MDPRRHLKQSFDKLARALPSHIKDGKPLGAGSYGVAVENSDLTVSKFLFRPAHPTSLDLMLKGFYREATLLQCFATQSSKDMPVPILLGDVEEIYHPDFAAKFTMTKIDGISWWSINKKIDKSSDKKTVYETAGMLTARFHAISSANIPPIAERNGYDGQQIHPVPRLLTDKTNRALETANEFLQAYKKPGLVHGDLGEHNFVYRNGVPVGLVDFSFGGISSNQYADFAAFMDRTLPHFITGYERESGEKIDQRIVTATKLSYATNELLQLSKYMPPDDKWTTYAIVEMNTHLNNLIDVTGFKP